MEQKNWQGAVAIKHYDSSPYNVRDLYRAGVIDRIARPVVLAVVSCVALLGSGLQLGFLNFFDICIICLVIFIYLYCASVYTAFYEIKYSKTFLEKYFNRAVFFTMFFPYLLPILSTYIIFFMLAKFENIVEYRLLATLVYVAAIIYTLIRYALLYKKADYYVSTPDKAKLILDVRRFKPEKDALSFHMIYVAAAIMLASFFPIRAHLLYDHDVLAPYRISLILSVALGIVLIERPVGFIYKILFYEKKMINQYKTEIYSDRFKKFKSVKELMRLADSAK